ncbi:MAG: protocatechuate 3,4-dioxygenase [Rhodospirillales bacterium]|nr:protocatechuate 3,4-dioxygenase [Rhodospirillales bacterium]
MAEIILGVGSSHGPLLNLPPEEWEVRANFDRAQTELAYRDGTYTFQELSDLRKSDYFIEQMELDVKRERHAKCQKQLDDLGEQLRAAEPDVVLVVGDDQREWFFEDSQPAFAVYCGSEVHNKTWTDAERIERINSGRGGDLYSYRPKEDQVYPVETELAELIVGAAMDAEIDVAASMMQPKDPDGKLRNIGHAYGFIYRRLLLDKAIPIVPILQNTFYPPNQPKPKRCFELGRAIGRAIRDWKSDKRVAVVASGGISHFVVDEEWDAKMLNALQEWDLDCLLSEPNIMFRSGSSETKNWITAAGILSEPRRKMELHGYVPCYRSEAGTGSGMAFATWR